MPCRLISAVHADCRLSDAGGVQLPSPSTPADTAVPFQPRAPGTIRSMRGILPLRLDPAHDGMRDRHVHRRVPAEYACGKDTFVGIAYARRVRDRHMYTTCAYAMTMRERHPCAGPRSAFKTRSYPS